MSNFDILSAYLYNRRCHLEHDVQQLQDNLRYRSVTVEDCIKLIIARERLSMFIEISNDIKYILRFKSGIPP